MVAGVQVVGCVHEYRWCRYIQVILPTGGCWGRRTAPGTAGVGQCPDRTGQDWTGQKVTHSLEVPGNPHAL